MREKEKRISLPSHKQLFIEKQTKTPLFLITKLY
jgi:hypothetical protein